MNKKLKPRSIRRTVRYAEHEIEKVEKSIKKGKFLNYSEFARERTLK
jgi:hypothetical protein